MKYLMLFFVLALATAGISTQNAEAQATIFGKVTDGSSNEPILFATVALYSNGKLIQGTETDFDGNYSFSNVALGEYEIEASYVGYSPTRIAITLKTNAEKKEVNIQLKEPVLISCIEIVAEEKELSASQGISKKKQSPPKLREANKAMYSKVDASQIQVRGSRSAEEDHYIDGRRLCGTPVPDQNAESYGSFQENAFQSPTDVPLSTFSIDVDRASYSNVRRFINNGSMPPTDAVQIEEMINYFDYEYEGPKRKDPFAIHTHLTACPWNETSQILHIGLQGKKIETEKLPASNLVFLIDVSGSMRSLNKLPLLKSSFKLLINQLRDKDKVSIVVYAGAAGLVLPPTNGNKKQKIFEAIDNLSAGGSTAGGQGIKLAYKTAREHFIKGGNNRVILATDGDFNVGASSDEAMETLIEKERQSGVFLSVMGYGMGNYKDSKMEVLAEKGNGNHAYIDNIQEAKKVFVNEFGGTLFTIAKDVKIQIEFNPNTVQAYRLVGYESRLLNKEDFNDDTKDAGELGAGHVVTALYEIVPVGVDVNYVGNVDPLKYQKVKRTKASGNTSDLATIKLRYKKPDGNKSKKLEEVVKIKDFQKAVENDDVNFSLAVAEFGMLLRQSVYKGQAAYKNAIALAKKSKGHDKDGYRSEFIRLVETVEAWGDLASEE